MRPVDALIEEYGESHKNPTNKAIHWICVPAIFFSTVGLFWSIPQGPLAGLIAEPYGAYLNWATLVLLLTTIWYWRMSVPLAVGMVGMSVAMIALCVGITAVTSMPLWQTSLIVFVVAWIGQFIGHKIEGKKPSFFKDLQFLLVGPMWLLHFIYKRCGVGY
jgi:uncharacterized membrane protein YGL010W